MLGRLRRQGVELVSAGPGVQTDRGGGGDEETEINSVRTGFIPPGPQNWAGPGRKSEEERAGGGAAVLFLTF